MIYIYDYTKVSHDDEEFVFLIDKPSVLSNPYSECEYTGMNRSYLCKTREEAVERYEHYFNVMNSGNRQFRNAVDELYELYKNGKDVYLACENRGELCHGDIIKRKVQERLLREKIKKQ